MSAVAELTAKEIYKAEVKQLVDDGDLEAARERVCSAVREGLVCGHEGAADMDPILDAAYRMIGR